jgi:hypothetical protein
MQARVFVPGFGVVDHKLPMPDEAQLMEAHQKASMLMNVRPRGVQQYLQTFVQ